jgi:hypothetical protein
LRHLKRTERAFEGVGGDDNTHGAPSRARLI